MHVVECMSYVCLHAHVLSCVHHSDLFILWFNRESMLQTQFTTVIILLLILFFGIQDWLLLYAASSHYTSFIYLRFAYLFPCALVFMTAIMRASTWSAQRLQTMLLVFAVCYSVSAERVSACCGNCACCVCCI